MKALKTFLQGKLTGLGLVGVMINDLLANWTDVIPVWEQAAGSDASVLQLVSAAAIFWGVIRRFTATYQRAKAGTSE